MKRISLMFVMLLAAVLSFTVAPILLAALPTRTWQCQPNSYEQLFKSLVGNREIAIQVGKSNGQDVTLQIFQGTTPAYDNSHKPVHPAGSPTTQQTLGSTFDAIISASEVWICRGSGSGPSSGPITWQPVGGGTYADGSWGVDVDTFDTLYSGSARSIAYSIAVDEGEDDVLLQVIHNSTFLEQIIVSEETPVAGIADDVTTLQISTLGETSTGSYAYYYKTGLYHVGE